MILENGETEKMQMEKNAYHNQNEKCYQLCCKIMIFCTLELLAFFKKKCDS